MFRRRTWSEIAADFLVAAVLGFLVTSVLLVAGAAGSAFILMLLGF